MLIDKLITTFDTGLRTVLASAHPSRSRPDTLLDDSDNSDSHLSDEQKNLAISLMRINHLGEVCAQALYSGQAFTSRSPFIVDALKQAAVEETDHLSWCETRIQELGGRKSFLSPVMYTCSFTLGAIAGAIGDEWNLGFLAETETQVGAHLGSHLEKLSHQDTKTRAIVEQMHIDETAHAQEAKRLGAAELPEPIKVGMKFASKIMTTTAYYI
jgi:3-demethoxyubiquinol 3-hydroxylase